MEIVLIILKGRILMNNKTANKKDGYICINETQDGFDDRNMFN